MISIMRNSNKKPQCCSLCFALDHRAGPRCPVGTVHKAKFIASAKCKGFAETFANPSLHLVETPDAETIQEIKSWTVDSEHSIPSTAHHMVIKNCCHSARSDSATVQSLILTTPTMLSSVCCCMKLEKFWRVVALAFSQLGRSAVGSFNTVARGRGGGI